MNIVIKSTDFTVQVEFNDCSKVTKMNRVSFRRNELSEVVESQGADHVTIVMLDDTSFDLSYTSNSKYSLVVDSVNGVTPTDNNELYDMLVSLQQTQ